MVHWTESFAEELTKLSEEPETKPSNAGAVGLGAAAAAAPLAYAALRRKSFSSNPIIRRMQEASKGRMARTLGWDRPKSKITQAKEKLLSSADELVYWNDKAPKGGPKKFDGVVHHRDLGLADNIVGNANPTLANQKIQNLSEKLEDKMEEARFFQKHAPGAMPETHSMADVLKEMGIKHIPRSDRKRQELLQNLQKHLHKKFKGDGFVMKETKGVQSSGLFPSDKHDLAALASDYKTTGLDKRVAAHRKAEWGDKSWDKELSSLKKDPAYAGRVLDDALRDPSTALVQRKVEIEKPGLLRRGVNKLLGQNTPSKELRVHVMNGQVIPELTLARFDPTMHVFDRGHFDGANKHVDSIMGKLPEQYRKGSFSMDVAPIVGGGYKMIESNPGSVSDVISPRKNPIAGALMRKGLTGQWGKGVATGGAVAGSVAVGGAAAGATKAVEQHQEKAAFNASYYSAPLSYGPIPQASQASGKAPEALKVKPTQEAATQKMALALGMRPPALFNNPIKKTVTIASISKPMGKGTGTALPGAGNPARAIAPPKIGGN